MRRRRAVAAALTPVAALVALGLGACDTAGDRAITGPDPVAAEARSLAAGAVYTATNSAAGNDVLVFPRNADGTLGAYTAVATGGTGTSGGLGNQGGVVLSDNGQWLLVVNAGSDDVTVFRVRGRDLELSDVAPSGGDTPISIAIHDDLVYVLNAGMPNNVTGFRLSSDGALVPIVGSARPLSAAATGPAQAQFDPSGQVLAVTEKATNRITTFAVEKGTGLLDGGRDTASPGQTPFGFDFTGAGTLVVSEAFGGAPGASTLSSFAPRADASLDVISTAVPSGQTAACWVAISKNGDWAFTTNTGSGTVSAYAIAADGGISLAHAVAASTGAGSTPIDMALSNNGRFAYVLAVGNATIRPYTIEQDGTLTSLGPVNLPGAANGLAAR